MRRALCALIALLTLAGCGPRPPKPTPSTPPPTTTTTTTTTAPPTTTTTTVAPPTTTTTPVPSGFPAPDTTGVERLGVALTLHFGDLVADKQGQVVDGVHVTGNLLVCADDVVIRNSLVDGVVGNSYCGDTWRHFTITDTTVGPVSGCISAMTAVGSANFTATRVHTRNVADGFGVSANGGNAPVTVQDSLIELCGTAADHSDGIQLYLSGSTQVRFLHNTVNQLPCDKKALFAATWPCTADAAQTAPVFVSDDSDTIEVRGNLLIGGSSTIRVGTEKFPVKSAVVTGNVVLDGAWISGPVDSHPCDKISWSGNVIGTVDVGYRLVSTARSLPCQ